MIKEKEVKDLVQELLNMAKVADDLDPGYCVALRYAARRLKKIVNKNKKSESLKNS